MKPQFKVTVTVNGRENNSGEFLTYRLAEKHANRIALSSVRHLESYRVEIVELFGDKSRYVIMDKSWE